MATTASNRKRARDETAVVAEIRAKRARLKAAYDARDEPLIEKLIAEWQTYFEGGTVKTPNIIRRALTYIKNRFPRPVRTRAKRRDTKREVSQVIAEIERRDAAPGGKPGPRKPHKGPRGPHVYAGAAREDYESGYTFVGRAEDKVNNRRDAARLEAAVVIRPLVRTEQPGEWQWKAFPVSSHKAARVVETVMRRRHKAHRFGPSPEKYDPKKAPFAGLVNEIREVIAETEAQLKGATP